MRLGWELPWMGSLLGHWVGPTGETACTAPADGPGSSGPERTLVVRTKLDQT